MIEYGNGFGSKVLSKITILLDPYWEELYSHCSTVAFVCKGFSVEIKISIPYGNSEEERNPNIKCHSVLLKEIYCWSKKRFLVL